MEFWPIGQSWQRNARVPDPSTWSPSGLVGRINSGKYVGQYIWVELFKDSSGKPGPWGFWYNLQAEKEPDADEYDDGFLEFEIGGQEVRFPDQSFDEERSDGTGSWIDLLTSGLDISWDVEPGKATEVRGYFRGASPGAPPT